MYILFCVVFFKNLLQEPNPTKLKHKENVEITNAIIIMILSDKLYIFEVGGFPSYPSSFLLNFLHIV